MTAQHLIHVHAPGDRDLRMLLKAWTDAVIRYVELCDYQDNCWWYNERASISILAGAAWGLGWSGLEEYSSLKRARLIVDGVEDEKHRLGRVDLYLINKKTSFTFEAKQAWQRIGGQAEGTQYVKKGLEDAWDDSGDLIKQHSDRRFAATFIVPSLPIRAISMKDGSGIDSGRLSTELKSWLARSGGFCRNPGKETAFAYVFPRLGTREFNGLSRHFPGVVIVLEERLRSSKHRKS